MSPRKKQSPMKIDELAAAAGVPVRTVRYYLARGVLPAPEFRGPHTVYGPEYLARLRAIQKLQEDYLPLDAIAEAVAGRSVAELELLAREGVGRRVLGAPLPGKTSAAASPTPQAPPAPLPPLPPLRTLGGGEVRESGLAYREVVFPDGVPATPLPVRATRWRLAPGVELVVDEDASPAARRLAERLLAGLRVESEGDGEVSGGGAKKARSGKRPSRKRR